MDTRHFPEKPVFLTLILLILAIISCNLMPLLNEPPTIQMFAPASGESVLAGNPLEITFLASGGTGGISFVELTLNSINGQSLASYGSPDAQGETSLRASLNWTPDQAGEFNLYLTAYDSKGQASVPATATITVIPFPEILNTGSKVFLDSESFDFVAGTSGEFVGGDLYIAKNGPSSFSAVANNPPQVGGVLLFNTRNSHYGELSDILVKKNTIQQIIDGNTQNNISPQEVPLELWGVYLYQRHQKPGDYILLICTGIVEDSISFDYVVFNLSK